MGEGDARGQREAKTREADAACERAWAKRGKALEIIRREMYQRHRKLAFESRPDGVIWDIEED